MSIMYDSNQYPRKVDTREMETCSFQLRPPSVQLSEEERIEVMSGRYCVQIIDRVTMVNGAPAGDRALDAQSYWKREEMTSAITAVVAGIFTAIGFGVALTGYGKVISATILATYGAGACTAFVAVVAIGTVAALVLSVANRARYVKSQTEILFWNNQVLEIELKGYLYKRVAQARKELYEIYKEGGEFAQLGDVVGSIIGEKEARFLMSRFGKQWVAFEFEPKEGVIDGHTPESVALDELCLLASRRKHCDEVSRRLTVM